MFDSSPPSIPLPARWPASVQSGILHVISLAHYAILAARGWAANNINARVRLAAEADQLRDEAHLLREELWIKDARMARIDPRRRPYYAPAERMAILELRVARAWSLAQTARAFLVEAVTVASELSITAHPSRSQHREISSHSVLNQPQSASQQAPKGWWAATAPPSTGHEECLPIARSVVESSERPNGGRRREAIQEIPVYNSHSGDMKRMLPAVFASGADRNDGDFLVVVTIQRGDPPAVKIRGTGLRARVTVGKRVIHFNGKTLVLGP